MRPQLPIVIIPVCMSTSGHRFLEHDALGTLPDELHLLAAVITPKMDEDALLLHHLKRENKSLRAYHPRVMCCAPHVGLCCALRGGAVRLNGLDLATWQT